MDNDDRQIGQILSRREVLALLGTAGIALLAGCGPSQPSTAQPTPIASQAPTMAAAATTAPSVTPTATTAPTTISSQAPATNVAPNPTTASVVPNPTVAATRAATTTSAATAVPSCIVRPAVTEGPYYVNEDLNRSDIRSDPGTGTVKDGALLTLTFNVSQIAGSGCTALPGAKVEVWHCDAAGSYSDVSDPGFSTKGQRFLRGYQVTDANGSVTFTTIYPGWYRGRAIHIHFKIRPNASTEFTSQLFFDDTLSDQVLTQAPYASKGKRDTPNSRDSIYKDLLLLTVAKTGQGYAATFDIGMQKS